MYVYAFVFERWVGRSDVGCGVCVLVECDKTEEDDLKTLQVHDFILCVYVSNVE